MTFIWAGILLFSTVVLFQVVNLPVEFDASRRARQQLQATGLITPEEDLVVGKVLSAAAMTYVAGTLTSVLQLLFFVIRARMFERRRDDRYVRARDRFGDPVSWRQTGQRYARRQTPRSFTLHCKAIYWRLR
jgi:hypothetical protein